MRRIGVAWALLASATLLPGSHIGHFVYFAAVSDGQPVADSGSFVARAFPGIPRMFLPDLGPGIVEARLPVEEEAPISGRDRFILTDPSVSTTGRLWPAIFDPDSKGAAKEPAIPESP